MSETVWEIAPADVWVWIGEAAGRSKQLRTIVLLWLCNDLGRDLAGDVGQAKIASRITISQSLMIEPQ